MEAPNLVDPEQPLIDGFGIQLPFPMARRQEEGSLVFWHTPKRLSFWIDARERDPASDPLEEWQGQRSVKATDELVERDGATIRYSYRLAEESTDGRQPAFYGFVANERTEFLLAAYFDSSEMAVEVLKTWRSVRRND